MRFWRHATRQTIAFYSSHAASGTCRPFALPASRENVGCGTGRLYAATYHVTTRLTVGWAATAAGGRAGTMHTVLS